MRSHITRKLPPLTLGVALSMIGAVALAEDDPYPKLPGEPQVQPAQGGRLEPGQAISLAVDWAKFGKDPDAGKMVDAAITAISIGYPPAGAALGVAKGFIMGLAGGPDPVAEALKIMDKRISALERNVTELARGLGQVQDEVFRVRNDIRIAELQRRRDELGNLKGELAVMRDRNAGPREKAEFVAKVARLAARFRPDSSADNDMWQWSDMRVFRPAPGNALQTQVLNPDFKPLPMLESYVNALVLLMASIQFEGRDVAYVKRTYHDELMRHVQTLSVRPYWLEGQEQYTLPERLMARVNCNVQAVQKYPENGMCSARFAMCEDTLARRNTVVASGIADWHVASSNTLCTPTTNIGLGTMRPGDREMLEQKWMARADDAPWGSEALLRVRQYTGYTAEAEETLENFHGLETMTLMADRIFKLAVSGTLQEAPQYSFDHTYWDKEYLYGVKRNGELIWFGHLIGEDRNPPKENPLLRSSKLQTKLDSPHTNEATGAAASARLSSSAIARTSPSATISGAKAGSNPALSGSAGRVIAQQDLNAQVRQQGAAGAAAPEYRIVHQWEGPKTVGSGWQNFRDVIPAATTSVSPNVSGASFYAVTKEGSLLWYRHDGFASGEPKWKGPVQVGTGWQNFKQIVPAGDGVVYGIGTDGSLRWYKQTDVADPSAPLTAFGGGGVSGPAGTLKQRITVPSHWTGPNVVGSGWAHFVHVFSTGEGVIYAVDPQGKLWWYKHRGYLTGTQDWEGPKQVGTGWGAFRKVFSPSEGYIYALTQTGEMLWYQHQGYQDGSVRWRGPTTIGSTWGDYSFVFSAMQGTPQAPVVR